MSERFEDFALRLAASDNVAVAKRPPAAGPVPKRPLAAGRSLNGSISLVTNREIPAGHKIALATIGEGQPILKYGQVIGYARRQISSGEHVHTHNVRMRDDADERTSLVQECCVDFRPVAPYPAEQMRY